MLADGDAAQSAISCSPCAPPASRSRAPTRWALAGSRTASGKPLLSNDMHLEYSLPGIWYMTHLRSARPGCLRRGAARRARRDGGPQPAHRLGHHQSRVRRPGPVHGEDRRAHRPLPVSRADGAGPRWSARSSASRARRPARCWSGSRATARCSSPRATTRMALRWVAAEPGFVQYPILDIDRAQNWAQFTAALARLPGPGSNFVYADADGNIGYHAAGKLPMRRGYAGDVPVDGSSGDFEWDGFIPFDELPSAFNPPGGIIATANQNPFPAGLSLPGRTAVSRRPTARAQIRDLLSARNGLARRKICSACRSDVYSAFGKFLAGELVAAYDQRHAHVTRARGRGRACCARWNGQMERTWPRRFSSPWLSSTCARRWPKAPRPAQRPGLRLHHAPRGGRKAAARAAGRLVRRLRRRCCCGALADAVEEGKRIQGRDTTRWQYGAYLRRHHPQPGHPPGAPGSARISISAPCP